MSERDSDAPPDDSWNDDAPKSEPPPKPAADGIRRIDTVIGQHMPALIEEEVLKKAAAAAPASKPERPPRERVRTFEDAPVETGTEPGKKWRSPLQVGPDWLVALKSIPPKLVAIAGGGLVLGALLTLAMRGCTENRHVQELDERVALLERTVGVSLDGGRADAASSSAMSTTDDAGVRMAIASPTASSSAPTDAACVNARTDAYAAWQDALVKAKQNAAPAEAQCSHILTQQHRQSCIATALTGARFVQIARDAAMKGGAAARDAVKNVRDSNSAITTAKAASQAAFAACQDDNEL